MNEFLTNFHLIRPWWLLAIIPALVMIRLMLKANQRNGQWHSFIPQHLASLLIDTTINKKSTLPLLSLGLIWVVSIIALAGPSWQKLPQPLFKVSSAQIIVMDMSLSMYATDIKPNRLTRARFKVTDLLNQLQEGETGLVAYAGDGFVISPMTEDSNNLLNLLPALVPEIMPEYGSAPASGIEAALRLFEQTNKQTGDIYLVTDGISLSDKHQIIELLSNTEFSLHILAVGGNVDAPIKLPNGELLKDSAGNIVLPSLNLAPLIALTKQFDGRFAKISLDNSDIAYLGTTDHRFNDNTISQNKNGDAWSEAGPYLLLVLLPLVALSFRKGVLSSLVVGFTTLLFCGLNSPPLLAAPSAQQPSTTSNTWQDLWQTNDQQGIKAFNNGNFEQAATTFEDKSWQGSSLYNAKDYQGALTAFSQLSTPEALYNQGNALMQLQQYDQAIERYQQVLAAQPNNQAASNNLELANKLNQQQQQQEQDQQQQDGDDKQDQQQDQDQEQQGDKQQSDSESQQRDQDSQSSSESSDEQSAGDSDSEPQPDEAPAEQQQTDDDESQQSQKKQSEQQDAPAQQPSLFDDKNLTKEQQRHLEQLLKKIADDPSLLLRNKMAIEARKRRSSRIIKKDNVNW